MKGYSMRRKAFLSVILSVAMILGSVSPAFAAGEVPSDEVAVSTEASEPESQDEAVIKDDSTGNSEQKSVDGQETIEEETGTETESVEDGIGEEGSPDGENKPEADSAEEEEEKPETLVGTEGARVSVGENVTAGFDSETGTVTFYSQGGMLSHDWLSELRISKNDIKAITISSDSDVMYLPANSNSLFSWFQSLQSINLSRVDTSNVTDMSNMFDYCYNLQTLDLSGFNTSNVTDMSYMFNCCWNLQILDISGFDTSNVTSMCRMFDSCESLQTLDLSSFDTSNVTDMSEMFYQCRSLQTLDLSGFNTSNVTGMSEMFYQCSSLQTLDVSGFDTSNVTDFGMLSMFEYCYSLQRLDLSSFDMERLGNAKGFLDGNNSLLEIITPVSLHLKIELPGTFVDSTGKEYIFLPEGLSESICLTKRTLGEGVSVGVNVTAGFDSETGTVTFYSQGGTLSENWLERMCISKDTVKAITISDDSDEMYLPKSCYRLFYDFEDLQSLNLSKANTSNVINMSDMFYKCSSLQELDVSGFDTSEVWNMCMMFGGCSALQTLDLSGFDLSNTDSTGGMFYSCSNLLVLMTPVNVNVTTNLSDTYVDASGTEYEILPIGISESTRLTKKSAVNPVELEILSISDDFYGKTGTPASFHIEAEGSGTVSYQWQYRTAGMTDWKAPSQESAQTADYSFKLKPSYDNIEVRCIVSDDSGSEIISETRKANVFAYTSQPKDTFATEGQAVNFEVSAIGRNVTYQWYYKRPNSTWKKTTVSGSDTAVLPITAGTKNDGTSYRCVITDEAGNKITSAAGTLMLEIPLQITDISEDAYDVNGESVTFHIGAVGNGDLSYQWQYKMAGETNWRTPGQASAKTADYVFKLRPSYDNIEVRCIVEDAAGNSVTSDVRKANVFAITGQPQDTELAPGEQTTFAVEAVGKELIYQWYYKRPEGSWKKVTVAGYNTASLVITANTKNDGTKYRCRVTDGLGNVLVSAAALLTQP